MKITVTDNEGVEHNFDIDDKHEGDPQLARIERLLSDIKEQLEKKQQVVEIHRHHHYPEPRPYYPPYPYPPRPWWAVPYNRPWTLTSGGTTSETRVTANPNVTATPGITIKGEASSLREKIEGVFGDAKGFEGTHVVRNQASLTSYSSASARQTLI